jgi:hypothetical protein
MGAKKKDYEVGYGKPPHKHQWQKGQSGNPAGKKGKKGVAQPLVLQLTDQLSQEVTLTIGGKKLNVSFGEALSKKILHEIMAAPLKQKLEALKAFNSLGLLHLQQMQHAEVDGDGGGFTEEDRRLLEIIEKEVEGDWPEGDRAHADDRGLQRLFDRSRRRGLGPRQAV